MSSSSSKNVEARQSLEASTWFRNASSGLLDAMSEKMKLVIAPPGHVFVKEGDIIENIIIIQEGTLSRIKTINDNDEDNNKNKEEEHDDEDNGNVDDDMKHTVVIDELCGNGRVSGLLHNMQNHEDEKQISYATIKVANDCISPAKVWLLKGEELRNLVSSTPQYSLDIINAMAHELRVGSKSLTKLMNQKVTNKATAATSSSSAATTNDNDDDCVVVKTKNGKPKTVFKVLCYDATSWVVEHFKPAVEAFNVHQLSKNGNGNGNGSATASSSTSTSTTIVEMSYTKERLSELSVAFAAGYDAVCLFVNDTANSTIIQKLSLLGVKLIAMRCAGYDRVDTKSAAVFGLTVVRVPAYSPYAVAEMAVTLCMTVNRRITLASNRIKMSNFSLDNGLLGFDIHGKTIGVMGTGKIGQILCTIMHGFDINLLCYDIYENDMIKTKLGGQYVSKDEIFTKSDILFLMMPLLSATYHIIDDDVVQNKLKKGMILINTSRGGLMNTKAVLKGLQDNIITGVGIDVYENEQDYFFQDWSTKQVQDNDLLTLLANNNVVMTAHQAFFTKEAINKIVSTTIDNIQYYIQDGLSGHKHPNNCIPSSSSSTIKTNKKTTS